MAREVRRHLDNGVEPEDLLVLFRRWDEDAEVLTEVLRSWEIPISPLGRPRTLRTDPAVSALRLACTLPREGWEASGLVALLRHGRFQPRWPEFGNPGSSGRAASDLVKTRVFRGIVPLRAALYRLESDAKLDRGRLERFALVFARLRTSGMPVVDHSLASVRAIRLALRPDFLVAELGRERTSCQTRKAVFPGGGGPVRGARLEDQ